MPRYTHQDPRQAVAAAQADEQLRLVLALVNDLRREVGLAARTPAEARQLVAQVNVDQKEKD